MEKASNSQRDFFQQIKNSLPAHLSLVDEIAALLNISTDSAYRRIRGEKPILFDEIKTLCAHYIISLDQFFHMETDSFIFKGKLPQHSDHFFETWLKDVLKNYSSINSFEKKHIYFLNKDMPFHSFFQVPELAKFKFFLWMRSFMQYEDLKGKKFTLKDDYSMYEQLGTKIARVTNQIPSTEIWNYECINATIRQIEFYRETNIFQSNEEIALLYVRLEELVTHFERQAEIGKKYLFGESPNGQSADYQLYLNELFLGDNTVIAELENQKYTFLNHSVLHIVSTNDQRFCNYTYDAMKNMIRKSIRISQDGEKVRSRFFHSLLRKIQKRKDSL
jgi:hypothetical protein